MDKIEFKKSYHLDLHETVGLNVYNTGNEQCAPGYKHGPSVRPFYLLHYIISGKGIYKKQGKDYEVGKGEAFLIYPSSLCSYQADFNDPWEYSWVSFDGADAKRLLELTDFANDNPVLEIPDTIDIAKKIKEIYLTADATIKNEVEMVGNLYLILSKLIRISKKPEDNSPYGNKHMKAALKYIHNNFSENITVSDISGHIGISPSYLYRLFMKNQRISPSDYLTEHKISHACVLLRTGKYTVGEVANSVGYEDQLYFSRSFKKVKGMPPSEYMNRHLNKK